MASTADRDGNVFLAQLAEKADRFDDMVEAMKNVARMDVELTSEERMLLSLGYQKAVGSRRQQKRVMVSLRTVEEEKKRGENVERIGVFVKRIDEEVERICKDALAIVAIHLLPVAVAAEGIVFYYKMKGDYYRYLAELKTGNEQTEAAEQALIAYQAATSTAMTDLQPTHPVRLGLALNFSVFYYEIMSSTERACQLAKQSCDEAIKELYALNQEAPKDTKLILQLLNDNLKLWASELPERGEFYKISDVMED